MVKLNPISLRELIYKLKQFDFDGPFSGGKHLYMIKGNNRLTIPNPQKKEISVDLLTMIQKQAFISKEE